MTATQAETRSVVVERELPHPPEKIWRALTQPHLIEAWLMKNNFAPTVGHSFRLDAEWGGVDCKVLELEPQRRLAYAWEAQGLQSIVTWTLTPVDGGTRLRMVHNGFRLPLNEVALKGMTGGWTVILPRIGKLAATLA